MICKTKTRINTPAGQYSSSLLMPKGFRHTDFLNERGSTGFIFRLGFFVCFPQDQCSQNPPVCTKEKRTPASLLVMLLLRLNLFLFGKEALSMERGAFKRQDFTGKYDQTWGLGGGGEFTPLCHTTQTSYLSVPEEPSKSTPRPVLRCCYRSTEC